MDVAELDAALRAAGSAERAVQEKRYLKSDLSFYGVRVPAMRRMVRGIDVDRTAVVELAGALWVAPVFERRMCAALVLQARVGVLITEDLQLVERFVRDAGTWALVDLLATDVSGPIIATDHAAGGRYLDRWAADGDFWLRRAALLSPMKELKAGGGDWDRFARHADTMLEETEFFVRKAVGWVLRETAKQRPDLVRDWLLPRAHRASGLTVREAVKYLPADARDAVLAAR